MPVFGTVCGGQIVLDDPLALSHGLRVRIEPVTEGDSAPANGQATTRPNSPETATRDFPPDQADRPEWLKNLAEYVGCIEGPSDLAENHDHYAHGAPKHSS